MKKSPLENKIAEIARPVIEDMGLRLVAVNIVGQGGSFNVQIMAENPSTKTVSLDECAALSRSLSALLEVEDPIDGPYRLEVSSPGIDRPLLRIEDFADYQGFEAKVETDQPAENGQRKFRGRLKGVSEDMITIETDQGEAQIPFHNVIKAKLVLNDELINATSAT